MTQGTYLPLVGADNLIYVKDGGGVLCLPGTINGVAAAGRPGNVKTSLLLALEDATGHNIIPIAGTAALASVAVALPSGFAVPTPTNLAGFDYSAWLPVLRASVIAAPYIGSAVGAWETNLATFASEAAAAPANLANLFLALSAVTAPNTTYPYGQAVFTLSGKAVTADIVSPLIQVTIDFSASVAN